MKYNLNKILDAMITASVKAGDVIMDYYNSEYASWIKEDRTPVTEADIASSDVIIKTLKDRFADIPILCEETAEVPEACERPPRLDSDVCFIVDPIDGTRSFVEHADQFAVSIAFSLDHKNVVGVIFAPVTRTLYYAIEEEGAYRIDDVTCCEVDIGKGKRIHVSDRLDGLIVVTSNGKDSKAEELIERNRDRIAYVIKLSSCLKGCLIAEGTADVHYRFATYTKEWDTAAEEVICRAAGGVATDAFGDEIISNRSDYVNRRGIRLLNRIESALE